MNTLTFWDVVLAVMVAQVLWYVGGLVLGFVLGTILSLTVGEAKSKRIVRSQWKGRDGGTAKQVEQNWQQATNQFPGEGDPEWDRGE